MASSSCCSAHSKSAAFSAGLDAGHCSPEEYVRVLSGPSSSSSALAAPTSQQLASMTAVPAFGNAASGGKKKRARRHVGKTFNLQASRPQPMLTSLSQGITVTMDAQNAAWTTSVTVPTYFSTAFALTVFGGYTEYTSLFDQYRIDEIEVWIESSVIASPTLISAKLLSAVDLDDANTPTAITDVSMKQGVLISETTTGHYHRWQPHMAIAAYSGAFTSYSNIAAGWIDCASPSVQHYGIKAVCAGAEGVARLMTISTRAKVSFRGPGI